ncbi:Hypothetical_protein [Hexamita inflata]|uniref:Hypothetical_protein n=1 Tax=Hexamita inflata TaxID=28002 RepID=A0AA86UNZ3_9EUKA|nr:Hypothetical protein HINF_LOCUS50024 [Hexamita inflata]
MENSQVQWHKFNSTYQQIYTQLGECCLTDHLRNLILKCKFAIQDKDEESTNLYMEELQKILYPVQEKISMIVSTRLAQMDEMMTFSLQEGSEGKLELAEKQTDSKKRVAAEPKQIKPLKQDEVAQVTQQFIQDIEKQKLQKSQRDLELMKKDSKINLTEFIDEKRVREKDLAKLRDKIQSRKVRMQNLSNDLPLETIQQTQPESKTEAKTEQKSEKQPQISDSKPKEKTVKEPKTHNEPKNEIDELDFEQKYKNLLNKTKQILKENGELRKNLIEEKLKNQKLGEKIGALEQMMLDGM